MKQWPVNLLPVFAALLLGLFLVDNPVIEELENNALDLFLALRDANTVEQVSEAAIVLIDEAVIRRDFGYFDPLPRRYLAEVVDSLTVAGVRGIIVDIGLFDRFRLDSDGDTLLAEAFARAGNVIGISVVDRSDSALFIRGPAPIFRQHLPGVGHAMLQATASSGFFAEVRTVKPYISVNGQVQTALYLLAYCLYNNYKLDHLNIFPSNYIPANRGKIENFIPVVDSAMFINFSGPPSRWQKHADGRWMQQKAGAIPTFSSRLLTEATSFPKQLFTDKIIFLGNGSEYSRDQFITPYYGAINDYALMRGVEVHAHAFITLQQRRFITRLWAWELFILYALLAVLAVLMVNRWRLTRQLVAIFLGPLLIWIAGYLVFVNSHRALSVVLLSLIPIIGFVLAWCQKIGLSWLEKRHSETISHYRLGKLLGEGGMGRVFQATDLNDGRKIALKLLSSDLFENPENRRRFQHEGQILTSLDDPHIVKVYETGESETHTYIAMELLSGGTLKDYLQQHQPVAIDTILELLEQICSGIAVIHRHQIVHRDLKSANIMLDDNQRIRIMDFGLSKSELVSMKTSGGAILGTLGYVSPEQITGTAVDYRSDIFALGVIMYEMFTGKMPFRGDNEIAMIHSIFNADPPRPSSLRKDLPEALDVLILGCLAKSPGDRPQSLQAILDQLAAIDFRASQA